VVVTTPEKNAMRYPSRHHESALEPAEHLVASIEGRALSPRILE